MTPSFPKQEKEIREKKEKVCDNGSIVSSR